MKTFLWVLFLLVMLLLGNIVLHVASMALNGRCGWADHVGFFVMWFLCLLFIFWNYKR